MSENPSEASDKELEQVSGGCNHRAPQDQLEMQDAFAKVNRAMEVAASIEKKANEANQAIIRNIG